MIEVLLIGTKETEGEVLVVLSSCFHHVDEGPVNVQRVTFDSSV